MVDDRADYARFDYQLPYAQFVVGRRAYAKNCARNDRATILVDHQHVSGAIMLQPFCGYVLDVIGLKYGYSLFAILWSFISMAHGLAGGVYNIGTSFGSMLAPPP